jgi:prepilin-type N-terminal cleavage/methylation domain-containing protein
MVMKSLPSTSGFTLIELLIVVAIIAILALIAVPNFLEAQTRAKVSRVRSDLRTLGVAQESYFVDWNSYTNRDLGDDPTYTQGFTQLTSPIAYITSLPRDPFGEHRWPGNLSKRWNMFELGTGSATSHQSSGNPDNPNRDGMPADTFLMTSAGPDHIDDTSSDRGGFNLTEGNYPWNLPDNESAVRAVLMLVYDPTNGTVSSGQVYRTGGVVPVGRPYQVLWANSTGTK